MKKYCVSKFLLLLFFCYFYCFSEENLDKILFSSVINSEKADEEICNIEDLESLVKLEEKNGLGEESDEKGSILLTGDFGSINVSEMQEIVNHTLKDIDYKSISDNTSDEYLSVTVIHKCGPKSEHEKKGLKGIEQHQLLKSILKTRLFAKKFINQTKSCEKSSSILPLVIRNFSNNNNGIETMIINIKNDLGENIQKNNFIENSDWKNHKLELLKSEINKKFPNISGRLIKVGPKVFLSQR